MALDDSQIIQLITNPRESLSVELKDWIDPDLPEGISKIVKAVIAMRNNDGGYLLIGFNNEDGAPNIKQAPGDIENRFHVDKIQGYISKYSSEAFEVSIYYPEVDGKKFVVIESPSGVKTPVATKSGLVINGNHHIRVDKVFVRSMNSNNTPSTTEAKWKDWPQVVEKCFENREADVGRFLRRHLASISSEELRDVFLSLFTNSTTDAEENGQSLIDFLDASYQRYQDVVEERRTVLPDHGFMEVAVTISGNINELGINREFFNLIASSNPSYTGWPVWLDSRSFTDQSARPFVFQGFWEAFIASIGRGFSDHLDYWRISPEGKLYLYRGFNDDIGGGEKAPQPGTALDFSLAILRSAECIAVAIEFAKAMGCEEAAVVKFVFRWSGLKGRKLISWVNPSRYLSYEPEAYQDQVVTRLDVPVDTAKGALSGYVHQLINQLFLVFDGFQLSEDVTDDLVRRLLERRL